MRGRAGGGRGGSPTRIGPAELAQLDVAKPAGGVGGWVVTYNALRKRGAPHGLIFVAIAAVLQCYYGFYASGGPEGVGVAAGHAMRAAIVVVVIVNMLLTMAMFSLDSGARFGG